MFLRLTLPAILLLALLPNSPAADPKVIEPFNGKDLTGWKAKDEKKNAWLAGSAGYKPDIDPKFG
jgi:hypothetical protein